MNKLYQSKMDQMQIVSAQGNALKTQELINDIANINVYLDLKDKGYLK